LDVSVFGPNLRDLSGFETKLLDISGFDTKSCNMSTLKPINWLIKLYLFTFYDKNKLNFLSDWIRKEVFLHILINLITFA
jgi:hypothetical protein